MTLSRRRAESVPEKTRLWVLHLIREERDVFMRVRRAEAMVYDPEIKFGHRFKDDWNVFERLCGAWGPAEFGRFLDPGAAPRWGEQVAVDWHSDHGRLMERIWRALGDAAHADARFSRSENVS